MALNLNGHQPILHDLYATEQSIELNPQYNLSSNEKEYKFYTPGYTPDNLELHDFPTDYDARIHYPIKCEGQPKYKFTPYWFSNYWQNYPLCMSNDFYHDGLLHQGFQYPNDQTIVLPTPYHFPKDIFYDTSNGYVRNHPRYLDSRFINSQTSTQDQNDYSFGNFSATLPSSCPPNTLVLSNPEDLLTHKMKDLVPWMSRPQPWSGRSTVDANQPEPQYLLSSVNKEPLSKCRPWRTSTPVPVTFDVKALWPNLIKLQPQETLHELSERLSVQPLSASNLYEDSLVEHKRLLPNPLQPNINKKHKTDSTPKLNPTPTEFDMVQATLTSNCLQETKVLDREPEIHDDSKSFLNCPEDPDELEQKISFNSSTSTRYSNTDFSTDTSFQSSSPSAIHYSINQEQELSQFVQKPLHILPENNIETSDILMESNATPSLHPMGTNINSSCPMELIELPRESHYEPKTSGFAFSETFHIHIDGLRGSDTHETHPNFSTAATLPTYMGDSDYFYSQYGYTDIKEAYSCSEQINQDSTPVPLAVSEKDCTSPEAPPKSDSVEFPILSEKLLNNSYDDNRAFRCIEGSLLHGIDGNAEETPLVASGSPSAMAESTYKASVNLGSNKSFNKLKDTPPKEGWATQEALAELDTRLLPHSEDTSNFNYTDASANLYSNLSPQEPVYLKTDTICKVDYADNPFSKEDSNCLQSETIFTTNKSGIEIHTHPAENIYTKMLPKQSRSLHSSYCSSPNYYGYPPGESISPSPNQFDSIHDVPRGMYTSIDCLPTSGDFASPSHLSVPTQNSHNSGIPPNRQNLNGFHSMNFGPFKQSPLNSNIPSLDLLSLEYRKLLRNIPRKSREAFSLSDLAAFRTCHPQYSRNCYILMQNGFDIRLGEVGRAALKKEISRRLKADSQLRKRCVTVVCRLKNANVLQLLQMAEIAGCLSLGLKISSCYWKEYSKKQLRPSGVNSHRKSSDSKNAARECKLSLNESCAAELHLSGLGGNSATLNSPKQECTKSTTSENTGNHCLETKTYDSSWGPSAHNIYTQDYGFPKKALKSRASGDLSPHTSHYSTSFSYRNDANSLSLPNQHPPDLYGHSYYDLTKGPIMPPGSMDMNSFSQQVFPGFHPPAYSPYVHPPIYVKEEDPFGFYSSAGQNVYDPNSLNISSNAIPPSSLCFDGSSGLIKPAFMCTDPYFPVHSADPQCYAVQDPSVFTGGLEFYPPLEEDSKLYTKSYIAYMANQSHGNGNSNGTCIMNSGLQNYTLEEPKDMLTESSKARPVSDNALETKHFDGHTADVQTEKGHGVETSSFETTHELRHPSDEFYRLYCGGLSNSLLPHSNYMAPPEGEYKCLLGNQENSQPWENFEYALNTLSVSKSFTEKPLDLQLGGFNRQSPEDTLKQEVDGKEHSYCKINTKKNFLNQDASTWTSFPYDTLLNSETVPLTLASLESIPMTQTGQGEKSPVGLSEYTVSNLTSSLLSSMANSLTAPIADSNKAMRLNLLYSNFDFLQPNGLQHPTTTRVNS